MIKEHHQDLICEIGNNISMAKPVETEKRGGRTSIDIAKDETDKGNLRTDDSIEENYGILFEFEEELGNPPNKSKYISEIEEGTEPEVLPLLPPPLPQTLQPPTQQPHTPSQAINNRKALKPHKKHVAASVPVAIPARLSSVNRPTWTDYYDDSDEEESKQFVEPHELAAKTYHEHYLKTGFELDVPTSQTKRIKSFI